MIVFACCPRLSSADRSRSICSSVSVSGILGTCCSVFPSHSTTSPIFSFKHQKAEILDIPEIFDHLSRDRSETHSDHTLTTTKQTPPTTPSLSFFHPPVREFLANRPAKAPQARCQHSLEQTHQSYAPQTPIAHAERSNRVPKRRGGIVHLLQPN